MDTVIASTFSSTKDAKKMDRVILCLLLVSLLAATQVLAENYVYANVPHKDTYEYGYHRGNPHHFQERHEKRNGPKFTTKVRWGDQKGGYGEHYYDYNHDDKHHGHHGGGGGGGGGGY